eukprot:gene10097-7065_t
MQGNWKIFQKNARNFVPGINALIANGKAAYETWLKIYDRGYELGPVDFKEQKESYTVDYWKRGHCQKTNMWVDRELQSAVSQKDIAQLRYLGGYALPLAVIWLANDTWIPSTFNVTEEEKKSWREAQDLYRYRSAPSYLTETKSAPGMICLKKNDVRRDPKIVRNAAEMYDHFFTFVSIRRKTLRHLSRSMNLPTFPMLTRLCNSTRVKDYWNLIFNEDYMTITNELHESMSDEELYDFAWRRFLAPYDKELTREMLLTRINDYFDFLGEPFLADGTTPNLIILTNYVLGYYNDPAFLEEDITALEGNDFEYMASYGKDAFLRRLEFENGPLRDQVEAHTQKLLAEREAQKKYGGWHTLLEKPAHLGADVGLHSFAFSECKKRKALKTLSCPTPPLGLYTAGAGRTTHESTLSPHSGWAVGASCIHFSVVGRLHRLTHYRPYHCEIRRFPLTNTVCLPRLLSCYRDTAAVAGTFFCSCFIVGRKNIFHTLLRFVLPLRVHTSSYRRCALDEPP